MSIANHQRVVGTRDTKSNIEALTGTLEEQIIAYASDTQQFGIYTNGGWVWIEAGETAGSAADHVHGLFRWAADGTATVDLPDVAEYVEAISDDGSIVDPNTYTLSDDGSQITFDASPTAASVMVAQYVILRI